MNTLIYILFGVAGAVITSFLHCVAYRQANQKSWANQRSVCDHCGKKLRICCNIPLISFILLRGRSSCCRKRLSLWHPFLELVGVLLFLIVAQRLIEFGNPLITIRDIIIAAFAVRTLAFDGRYMLVYPPIPIAAALIFIVLPHPELSILNILVGGAVGAGVFLVQWALTKGKGVGAGDIWLGLAIGTALGWPGTLLALLIAYVVGAITAMYLLISKKRTRKDPVPMGVFLVIGLIVIAFYASEVIYFFNLPY